MTNVPRAIEANCISGDATIKSSAGVVYGVLLSAGGADATLVLYDNTAASGERELVITAKDGYSEEFCPAGVGLKFNTGIYADITGSGAYATILYE